MQQVICLLSTIIVQIQWERDTTLIYIGKTSLTLIRRYGGGGGQIKTQKNAPQVPLVIHKWGKN